MTVNPADLPQEPTQPYFSSSRPEPSVEALPMPTASVISSEPSDPSTSNPPNAEVIAPPVPLSAEPTDITDSSPLKALLAPQVRFKSAGQHVELILPNEVEAPTTPGATISTTVNLTWMELWQQLKQRLHSGQRFWEAETEVHLIAHNRLLDGRQLQAISEALASVQLRLKRVQTSRRQTAVVAATAGYSVDQQPLTPTLQLSSTPTASALTDPLYVQMTLRSGTEVRHPGTVIVFGDVNPGSSIIADGDILVWGRLRGVAHAGARGNARCLIAALQMEPTQLRIAQVVARAPSDLPSNYYPEVAYVTPKGICIMGITEFSKNPFLS